MEPLRELFARTTEARAARLHAAHFSFNSTQGRCPACEGAAASWSRCSSWPTCG
jgi:excinuclease ABC subunit A